MNVSVSPRLPLTLLAAAPALLAGCLTSSGEASKGGGRTSCGVRAALDPRQPERVREHPPACSLPAAATVALACAVHDHVTSPGYRPPIHDDEGAWIEGQPVPTYAVSELRCRFISRDRNEAVCRFQLSIPDNATVNTQATFEHRFVEDHGPAHHWYGTNWFAKNSCVSALVRPRRGR
jgi:hypothetical protein